MIKKITQYIKILAFAILVTSGMAYCSTGNMSQQQNGVETVRTIVTKTGLFKEYICSTLGALIKLGSAVYSIASISALLLSFDNSISDGERREASKFLFLSGLPMSIILWKTGDFLAKLGKI